MGKFWSRTELLSEVQCFLRSKRDSSQHGTCCRASSSQRCTSRTGCWTAKRHRHGQWMVVVGWSLKDAFGCLNLSYLLLEVCFVLDISNSSPCAYRPTATFHGWNRWNPCLMVPHFMPTCGYFTHEKRKNCLMGRPRMGWQRLQITNLGDIIKPNKTYDLIVPLGHRAPMILSHVAEKQFVLYGYKVVPQFGIAKLVNITPIKPMVYGRYNELVHGVYKPTNITGGHHPVHCHIFPIYFPYISHIFPNTQVLISGNVHGGVLHFLVDFSNESFGASKPSHQRK